MNLKTVLQNCQRNDELQAITVKIMKSSWTKSWFKSVNTQYLVGRFYADLRISIVSTGTSYPPCRLQGYWYSRLQNCRADNTQRSGAETISWHPAEMYFTFVLWRRRCDTWPDFRRWTLLFFIFSVHIRWRWCARIKQKHWFWLEGRATVTHADGLMPYWGSWLVEVGDESLCQLRRRGGVGSNEERRFRFTLSSPQSHIKGLKAVMNPHLSYFQYTHQRVCTSAHTLIETRRLLLEHTGGILIFVVQCVECMNRWRHINWIKVLTLNISVPVWIGGPCGCHGNGKCNLIRQTVCDQQPCKM